MFSRSAFRVLASAGRPRISVRPLSTLEGNSHIYVFPHPREPKSHLLTLLPTSPPNPDLALGATTSIPPTPYSTTENPTFHHILQSVVAENSPSDPNVQSQAAAFASTGGASLGSGGIFFASPAHKSDRNRRGRVDDSHAVGGSGKEGVGGAANAQGGMGGAGRGGYIHVSDERHPPDFGRIADPEDIFGSLEVDGEGRILPGTYQVSGTYRLVTRDGVLGLSDYLRGKLVERLKLEETARSSR